MEVDPLPGANPTVDVLETLGEKGAHGSPGSFAFRFVAAMDATNADAEDLADWWFPELVAAPACSTGALVAYIIAVSLLGCLVATIGDIYSLEFLHGKDLQEFGTNKAMEAVEFFAIVGAS